jgi:hypothetical protein
MVSDKANPVEEQERLRQEHREGCRQQHRPMGEQLPALNKPDKSKLWLCFLFKKI